MDLGGLCYSSVGRVNLQSVGRRPHNSTKDNGDNDGHEAGDFFGLDVVQLPRRGGRRINWSLEPRTSPFPCEIFVLTEEGGYKFSQPLHILCHENDVFRFSPIRPMRSTDISAYCGQNSLFKKDALVFFALSDKTRLHPGNLIEVMREDCQKLDDQK